MAHRGENDRPSDPKAPECRTLACPLWRCSVVGFCGPSHPLRPYLFRHGLRQPLPLRAVREAACSRTHKRREYLPKAQSKRGVDPHPCPTDRRGRDPPARSSPAGTQRQALLSQQQEVLLPLTLPPQLPELQSRYVRVTYKATDTQPERRYYQCHGKDPIMSAREHKCLQRPAKANELEESVWEHVKGLMRDPERLLAQFEEFARSTAENSEEDTEQKKFEGHIKRLFREESRLVDAYQAGIIELEELEERRTKIAQRRKALSAQYEQRSRLRRQAAQAREVLEDLKTFCGRVNARLEEATFEEKQAVLQLLIERIIVGEDTLEIRHVIPLDGPPRSSKGFAGPPESGLRSDGVLVEKLFGKSEWAPLRGPRSR